MNSKFLSVMCAGVLATGFGQEVAAPATVDAVSPSDVAALVERMARLEAALQSPSAEVTALTERLAELEATNRAQAARIAELEAQNRAAAAAQEQYRKEVQEIQALYHRDLAQVQADVREETKNDIAQAKAEVAEATKKEIAEATALKWDPTTERSESGRIFTTDMGRKYYLADVAAGIFQPLTESGLQITPYGYLTFEAVHNTHKTMADIYTDWVLPRRNGRKNGDHQTVFSMNDSILGFNFDAPEAQNGWKFRGKFEFDLAGDDANHPDFHFRHLYFAMNNEESGWDILFGQTWHLWKMVTPNEIDGAWLEQTGHPYRRSPQLRVTKTFTFDDESQLDVRLGIVKNGNGMGGDRDEDENQDNAASAWPLFEGAVVYARKAGWEDAGRRWLVGLAGMYGRDKSHRFERDANDRIVRLDASDEYDTDMVMAALQLPFLEKFTLTGQLFAGENLAGVQAGIGQGVAMRDSTRKGREVSTIGGFADLRYDLDDRWAFAVGYGFDDPTDSKARDAEDRTYNERAYIDAFYRFNANLHFGLEYARLRTKYYRDDDADDDRFQFTAYYDF